MEWQLILIAAITGYLTGSISFARILMSIFAPGEKLTGIEFGASSTRRPVNAISGTAVSIKLGPQYGGMTAILDILKTALPALVFRIFYPETPYFLISAAASLLGHNWPLYHRFKGGMGMSPIYGGFFVLDFWGTIITAIVSMFFGVVVLKMIFVMYLGGLWLMIPWVWFRTHNLAYLAYVLFVNVIFFFSLLPEIKETVRRRRAGEAADYSAAMDMTPMGKMIKRMATRAGFFKKEENPE